MKHVSRRTAGDGGAIVLRTGLQDKLFHSLADCRGRRGKRSLAVGRRATFEKDRTGPLNAVHRRPAPGRTDCPVENTGSTSMILIPNFWRRHSRFACQTSSDSGTIKSSATLKLSDKCWLSYPQTRLYKLHMSSTVHPKSESRKPTTIIDYPQPQGTSTRLPSTSTMLFPSTRKLKFSSKPGQATEDMPCTRRLQSNSRFADLL